MTSTAFRFGLHTANFGPMDFIKDAGLHIALGLLIESNIYTIDQLRDAEHRPQSVHIDPARGG